MLSESELPQLRTLHPLRGVNDRALFFNLLGPGERSAVFGIQSSLLLIILRRWRCISFT